jgi:site-specific recombinase XerD
VATIYRKTYPVPIPRGAEIIDRRGQRMARWIDGNGNPKIAPLTAGGTRILHEAGCWYARYRDLDRKPCRVSTGCHDEQAARKVLADILAEMEKVKAGIITAAELKTAKLADEPVAVHLEQYLEYLRTKRVRGRRVSDAYRYNVRNRLNRLIDQCQFNRLADIQPEKIERWLEEAENKNLSAATRNEYLTSLAAFCSWAKKAGRLAVNPVAGIQKADRNGDRRHVRRALTADEVARLLRAARIRPIAELGRQSQSLPEDDKAGRSTWTYTPLAAENLEEYYARGLSRLEGHGRRRHELEHLGRERALFYLLAASTGLRRKELASLTVGQLHLDGARPWVELLAEQAKNAKGAFIPLRVDVVGELQAYLMEHSLANNLNERLFRHAPAIRVFDADLKAAGIAKRDARNRVADIHALRHTFGTHLSAAGVHPRTAMAAMRHSRIELTMNYYTDPVLLDIAGAVEALPSFQMPGSPSPALSPTGTDNR